MNAVSQDSFSLAKYVIQGSVKKAVKDEEGNPVEGAALHIGREVAYADDSGCAPKLTMPRPMSRLSYVRKLGRDNRHFWQALSS